jgi:hypothetical protein
MCLLAGGVLVSNGDGIQGVIPGGRPGAVLPAGVSQTGPQAAPVQDTHLRSALVAAATALNISTGPGGDNSNFVSNSALQQRWVSGRGVCNSSQLAAQEVFDLSALEFDLTPAISGNLMFQYVFGSDEYRPQVFTAHGGSCLYISLHLMQHAPICLVCL